MLKCSKTSDCMKCFNKLQQFSGDKSIFDNLDLAVKSLSSFLLKLDLNNNRRESSHLVEENLAKEILTNWEESKDLEDLKMFLEVFSLSQSQVFQITNFIGSELEGLCPKSVEDRDNMETEAADDDSEGSESESSSSAVEEEYFDSE